jgi:N-methylhydantoinase B
MLISHGSEVPNSLGLFGGLEGSCNEAWLLRGGELEGGLLDVHGPEALRGSATELGPKPGFFELRRGDVFAYSFQGGGGYGDPLDRDPHCVLDDVLGNLVTAERARSLYGVVIRDGRVDADATARRRADMRTKRVPDRTHDREEVPDDGTPVGPALRRRAGRLWCRCGEDLGPVTGDFKDHAATRVVSPHDHGEIVLHEELELREHLCPGCATLLESEVARISARSLHSLEFRA